jgi:hypothetical protein
MLVLDFRVGGFVFQSQLPRPPMHTPTKEAYSMYYVWSMSLDVLFSDTVNWVDSVRVTELHVLKIHG